MHSVFFWWSLDQIINKSSFAEHTHSIPRQRRSFACQVFMRVLCACICVCVCLCLCGIAQGNIFKRACGCQENVLLDRATVAPSAHRFFAVSAAQPGGYFFRLATRTYLMWLSIHHQTDRVNSGSRYTRNRHD